MATSFPPSQVTSPVSHSPQKRRVWPKTKSDEYELPSGWKRAFSKQHNGRPYFMDPETNATTWVDPRDKLWKKLAWEQCGPEEIPYGWEVAEDPVVGKYFIDHINRRNVLDDPRSKRQKEQLDEVKQVIDKTAQALEKRKKELQEKEQQAAKLKETLKFEGSLDDLFNEAVSEEERKLAAISKETKMMKKQIMESEEKLYDMTTVVQVLEENSSDQLQRQRQVQEEIASLEKQLHMEAMVHDKLATELGAMQETFESEQEKPDPEVLKRIAAQVGKAMAVAAAPVNAQEIKESISSLRKRTADTQAPSIPTEPVDVPHPEENQKTRIEREMELLALRKRLQVQKEQTERLREIVNKAHEEVDRALTMAGSPETTNENGKRVVPTWIKLLNEHAKNTDETFKDSVREKANKAVQEGGVMNFKEKLLFFASVPLEKEPAFVTLGRPTPGKLKSKGGPAQ